MGFMTSQVKEFERTLHYLLDVFSDPWYIILDFKHGAFLPYFGSTVCQIPISWETSGPRRFRIRCECAFGSKSKDSDVLNIRALVELRNGNKALAKELFKRAIKIDPGNIAARMNLGVLLLKYRQIGGASVQFERVLKIMPHHQDARLHIAIIKASRVEIDSPCKR